MSRWLLALLAWVWVGLVSAQELRDDAGQPLRLDAAPRRIVVDFSAPNIAKPMHVGHIRSTFLGDALARTARFLGHEVITDNHVGDWGTQFGMILHGWKTRLDREALARDPIHELVRVYKTVNAEAKADETVLETCKGELVRLTFTAETFLALYTAGAVAHKAARMAEGGSRKEAVAAAVARGATVEELEAI